FASIVAAGLIYGVTNVFWPYFVDKIFYKGIRVDGIWEIYDIRDSSKRRTGIITLRQRGHWVTGTSERRETRQGATSDRRFKYKGRIANEQLTLLFEDQQGRDFDSGTYVFRVQNNCREMLGMATFHGKPENRIVSEERVLTKTPSALPSE